MPGHRCGPEPKATCSALFVRRMLNCSGSGKRSSRVKSIQVLLDEGAGD